MDFKEQLKEIERIQNEFGNNAMTVLLGLNHSDAILMKNIGVKFFNALLKEIEKDGKKLKYSAMVNEEFVYVTSRMDDIAKQNINDLIDQYLNSRKTIDNN